MKKTITTIILVLAIAFSYSQENTDAVFKKLVKEYTLNTDGSIDYREIKEIELHSHYAFHRLYGETFIVYNTDYQELKFNSAYTVMKDGKKVVTPDNAFNQVLPRFCNHAPAYNHIREMVVTHTGLEVGATINLDYAIHTKEGYYPGLMETELLLNSSPTEKLEIIVSIPEDKELYFNMINLDIKPDIKAEYGVKTYTWSFKDLPASSKERFQPADHTSEPQLQFSTLTFREAYDTFVNQEAFSIMTNETMNEAVEKVSSNCTDKFKIALKLQDIVCNNLGNINIPLEYSGYRCRNTIDTWKSNQGTPLEKALLLHALLEKAGIGSEVITAIPTSYYGNTGDLGIINTFAVKVNIKKHGDIFLKPDAMNSQTMNYNWGGMAVLPLNLKGKVVPKFPKAEAGEIEMEFEINIDHAEEPEGKAIIDIEKQNNPYYKIYKDSAYVKRMIKGTSGVTEYKVINITPEETEVDVTFKPGIKTEGLYHYLELPSASNGVDSWRMTQLTKQRSAPLEIPQLISEEYKYTIAIPGDAYLVSEETVTIIENEVGSIKLELQQKENTITYNRSISFKKEIISILDYPRFKKIMDLWNTAKYREIVYKRTKK